MKSTIHVPPTPAHRREAFTLVELAIVLVIIGLLVGGVLVAQQLIETAKINRQVSQFREFSLAYNAFKLKYGSYPGDYASASTYIDTSACTVGAPCNGDGDGVIEFTPRESAFFWNHLSASNMIKGGYTGNYTTAAVEGIDYPKATIAENMGVFNRGFVDYSAAGNNYDHIAMGTYYQLGNPRTGLSYTVYYEDTILGTLASGIDEKFDDGLPLTGSMYTWNHNSCVTVVDTNAYELNSGDQYCWMWIKVQ